MQKTRKAVKKRFKITARGKVILNRTKRRHLAGSKAAKKKRAFRRPKVADKTDVHRVRENLPSGA
ncbi:MAG: 50S ribosomal protein L35 [Verrucomicrobiae bacterium]|nr:50S ribosomal protein L35 [Verrucomicrobiae bacterium]